MERSQIFRNNQMRLTLVGLSLLTIIFLAVYLNYFRRIDVVYTHLFYVVIIMVGLWFKRYVIPMAMFLGIFHIIMDYLSNGAFMAAPVLRASILLFVACGIYFLINQLECSHNNLDRIMKSVGDGIIVVDLNMKVTMLNKAAEKITGWTAEEAIGKDYNIVFNLSHENSEYQVLNPVDEVFRTDHSYVLTNHAVITDRSGNQISIEDSATPVKSSDGLTTGVVSIFRDITQRKAQAEKIEYLSYHDHLTGLYNRRYFEEELERIDSRRHYPLSIVMGDINSLKMINDAFGHLAGDGIIYATGKVIKKCCRPTDLAARWGGDEFVLLLPNADGDTAKKIVERMNQAAALASVDQGVLSIAFGWDTKYAVTENIMTVFKNAESRMYKQKLKMKPEVSEMTIATIMNTLFEKSGGEKNHAENVSFYCRCIAEAMHLSEQEIEIMKTASYLHDIGKVAIDKKVLEKADCLSDEEWESLKRHPEIGYHITNTSANQSEIALAILGHHEWWDGNGYPKGLSGTDIPLLSRITAIACAYDTILTKRPDKKPGNRREAVSAIMAGAGSQFDPEIVSFFVNQVINNLAVEKTVQHHNKII